MNVAQQLTPREREVARRLALGEKPKEIAATLGIAVKTVGMNSYRINQKLNVKTRAQFRRVAAELGLHATV